MKKNFILILFTASILMIPSSILFAAGDKDAGSQIDEDALFSDGATVIETENQNSTVNDTVNRKSFGISGEITGALSYSEVDQDFLGRYATYAEGYDSINGMATGSRLRPYAVGDFYLDARLKEGYKAFGSFEARYDASADRDDSSGEETSFDTRELFADFNLDRRLYMRAGKQVLSWGQCYLWNPTDLINVERKSFLKKLETREGTYGIKAHIPFGTSVNIYSFLDLDDAVDGGDSAAAGKLEFLVNDIEMALSIWNKRDFNPVYGYDISARLLGVDLKGELSYSHGSNREKVIVKDGYLSAVKDDDSDIFKASINLGRDFDFGEKSDRLNISMEMFYNGDGYSDNPFEDDNNYLYDDTGFNVNGKEFNLSSGDKKIYILGHNLYEPNYFSRYYTALFITLREFIISEMTLSVNAISNIEQDSFILSSGLSYTNINNMTSGITINRYLGDEDGEYRASGMKYDVLITTGFIF